MLNILGRKLTAFLLIILCAGSVNLPALSAYDRNQAVPVEKVLYGHIESIKNIGTKCSVINALLYAGCSENTPLIAFK